MISVIIVNYNAGAMLTECVRRVLASTVLVEVFVSDNDSKDDSLQQLNAAVQDTRLHVIENKQNLGFSTGNNRALPYTRGEYVLFLNPDCLVEPDTLANLQVIMEQRPDAGMAGCLIVNTDGTEQAGCRREIPTPGRAFMKAFGFSKLHKFFPGYFKDFNLNQQPLPQQPIEVPVISGAFMFVRRTALEKVGPLDEAYFLHCEDVDWCMRFQQAGQNILFVPTLKVYHAKGACSQTRPVFVQWHMHRGMVLFYRKFFRERYPLVLWWLVLAGIWLRFSLLVTKSWLLNQFAKS